MRTTISTVGSSLAVVAVWCQTAAASPFDGFSEIPSAASAQDVDIGALLQPVGLTRGDDGTAHRWYVAPIIGASWGRFTYPGTPASQNEYAESFTAGGAVGMAFSRPRGQWRVEVAGRYRDGIQNEFGQESTDNWSVLCNAWRDVSITKTFGLYGGGGIGAGGYRWSSDVVLPNESIIADVQATQFAWQAGGGVVYAVSDRITLDLGYRFYSLNDVRFVVPSNGGLYDAQFSASELLFQIRIYEPFRGRG
jgi:opacity protein-like surface antigen